MRGDHQRRCLDVGDVMRDRDALRFERAQNGGVVDEVAEDREWPRVGVLDRERDCIANTETHAEVSGSENPHAASLHRELYSVKRMPPGWRRRTRQTVHFWSSY